MNIETIRTTQISKIKSLYKNLEAQSDDEFIQPFGEEWPEFIVTADDDWWRYEFVDGEFIRGSHPYVQTGMKRFMEESRPYGVQALKDAIEDDYWGFILQHGIHPSVLDTPSDGYGGYNVSNSESSSVRHVTAISQGQHVSNFVLNKKDK